MSILSNISRALKSFIGMLFPSRCAVCGEPLTHGQEFICTRCRVDIPLTHYSRTSDNPMANRLRMFRPEIEEAAALFYFIQGSNWQRVIHRLKYKGWWIYGKCFGELLGYELAESLLYSDIDAVVAIPLHIRRRYERGYNQSEYIASGVAKAMSIKHIRGGVKRIRHNKKQATIDRKDRWQNVEGLFRLTDPSQFEGLHILLVDDVFTTGATILSCAEAILSAAPSCKISIATLAISHREFAFAKN